MEGETRKGLIWLRIMKSKSCCEGGNKILGSIKGGNFIVYLRNDYLLRKGPDPWSWLREIFCPEDGGSIFFYTFASHVLKYKPVSPRIPPHLIEKFRSILRHGKLHNVYRPLDGSAVVAVKESTRWK
jgi:hypothetical protein